MEPTILCTERIQNPKVTRKISRKTVQKTVSIPKSELYLMKQG